MNRGSTIKNVCIECGASVEYTGGGLWKCKTHGGGVKVCTEHRYNELAELADLRARVGELERGLGECVNVLRYIGSGVSASSMAKEYAELYKPLLTEKQIQEAHERVRIRYDEGLAVLLAEHAAALAKEAKA